MVKMREYYTPALVLGTAPRNEKDAQITLYTKDLGKVYAVARSIKKITSRLAGHLRVGALVDARLISAGSSYQLVDGLSRRGPCGGGDLIRLALFLEEVVPREQPDVQMWYTIDEIFKRCAVSPHVYKYLLQLMGFAGGGRETPICQGCKHSREVVYFYAPDIIFLCSACLSRVRIDVNETVPVS